MSRRVPGRPGAVVGTLALGTALLAVTATPWLSVTVSTALTTATVAVRGSEAVPAAPAAALVLLAGALALALAGPVARLVAAVVVAGAGALVVATTAGFLADPSGAAISAAAEVTGVRAAGSGVATTAWPVIAVGLGAVTLAGGVVVAVVQRSWGGGGRGGRYELPPAAGVSAGGTDPASTSRDEGAAAGDTRTRAIDDWDALSRGEDPT